MPVSRLRLRFALWFSVTFILGLGGLESFLLWSLRRTADRQLTESLEADGRNLAHFVAADLADDPELGLAEAASEILDEFVAPGAIAGLYGPTGERLAYRGPASLVDLAPPQLVIGTADRRDVPSGVGYAHRIVTTPTGGPSPGIVLTIGSTAGIEQEADNLLRLMVVTAPLVLLVGAGGGYLLSSRAVRPMGQLGNAIRALPPDRPEARLPASSGLAEVDGLAAQFNELLDRLRAAEARQRSFVKEAAHQIRTPLTILLGESELALNRADADSETATVMRRITTAATQMKRRVDELLLLAEAESTPHLPLGEFDLEALAFEVTDLMRARATATQHRIRLSQIEAARAVGSAPLLREAMVELIENACRYGQAGSAIDVSAYVRNDTCYLAVESSGATASAVDGAGNGLGHKILEWIAAHHHGTFDVHRGPASTRAVLQWPVGTPTDTPHSNRDISAQEPGPVD